jgi:hypothetical protein
MKPTPVKIPPGYIKTDVYKVNGFKRIFLTILFLLSLSSPG